MFIVGVWMMIGFIAAAGIVAYFVERRLGKQMHRHMCGIGIVLPCLFMALLFACCPNPLLVVKGFIFTMVLYYAAAQDIHKREVDDFIPVMIAITSFVGFNRENVFAMLGGAILTALPLFAAAYFKNGRVGGADIKLMAAAGLLLGAEKGLVALIIGLLMGVTATFIYRKVKKTSMAAAFPLVPYLSAGCFLAYLL